MKEVNTQAQWAHLARFARESADLWAELMRVSSEQSAAFYALAGSPVTSSRRRVAPASPGVYAIQAPNGRIKIGRSKNIRKRLKKLQAESPHILRFVARLSVEPSDEFKFHRQFARLRCGGEWFLPGEKLLLAIEAANTKEAEADRA